MFRTLEALLRWIGRRMPYCLVRLYVRDHPVALMYFKFIAGRRMTGEERVTLACWCARNDLLQSLRDASTFYDNFGLLNTIRSKDATIIDPADGSWEKILPDCLKRLN